MIRKNSFWPSHMPWKDTASTGQQNDIINTTMLYLPANLPINKKHQPYIYIYFKRPMSPIKLFFFRDHVWSSGKITGKAATLRFYLFKAGPTFMAVTWWCVAWLSRGKNLSKHLGNDWRFFRWRVGSGWNQWLDETSIVLTFHLPYKSQMLNVWYICLHLA